MSINLSVRQFVKVLLTLVVLLLVFTYYSVWLSSDIHLIKQKTIESDSIFFLETSGCQISYKRNSIINSRQACAVESAARMNPEKNVYLLYILRAKNDSLYRFKFESDTLIEKLLEYGNIQIILIDLGDYIKGTPLQSWYESKKLDKSKFIIEHSSDVLRYLTMWKYGGTYLDLDVVVMKNLGELGTDYMGAENERAVANGILSFSSKGSGHEIASMILEEVSRNFDGNQWGSNGPALVTKVLHEICMVKDVNLMTPDSCRGYRVLDKSTFYAIPYDKYKSFFDHTKMLEGENIVNGSFAIHVWNKFSYNTTIFKNAPQVLYGKTASEFCPYVYNNSGDTF